MSTLLFEKVLIKNVFIVESSHFIFDFPFFFLSKKDMGLNSRNMFTILVIIVVLSCISFLVHFLDALLFMSFFYFSNKSSSSDEIQNVKGIESIF